MTLTVPKAGSVGGRAANVRVEGPQAGGMIAQFGNQMQQVGAAIENDFLQREAQRFQTDLTADMNDLRLEVSAIGDPDAAEAHWRAGSDNLRNTYLSGQTEDGRDRVSEKNKNRFNQTFDELHNRNSFSLGRQTLAARQSQREATYLQYAKTATQQSQTADPEMRTVLLGQGIEQIDSLVASGAITPAQGEQRKQALSQDMDNARAIGMAAENPAGMIEALDAGEFGGLPADVQARYRTQANGRLAKMTADAARDAERTAKEANTKIGNKLEAIRDIRKEGMSSVDEAWLASDEAKAHPDYAETMAALSLSYEEPNLQQLTPRQLDAMIAGERARPVKHKYQTERVQRLETIKKTSAEGWATDPVAHAREVGLYVPDLPAFDGQNASDFAKGIKARVEMAADLVKEGYTTDPQLLSEAERAQIKGQMSIDNDPAERAALAGTLAAALPDGELIDDLSGDPVFSHVSGLVASGGSAAVATEIFRGQQVVAEKNITLPPVSERQGAAFESVSAFFADQPGGEKIQSSILASADALYAARIRREGPQDDIDVTVYRQALHEVMGGSGRFDGQNARGGMQNLRGALTPLPANIRAAHANEALNNMGRLVDGKRTPTYTRLIDDVPKYARIGRVLPSSDMVSGMEARSRADALWQAASISGGSPGINGEPIDGDTLSAMTLKAVGPDAYQLTYKGRSVADLTTGTAYTFRLSDLVRENTR